MYLLLTIIPTVCLLYLIRVIVKLYFAVWSVVGFQRVVHHIGGIVLNMLLQHRVPVN